MVEDDRPQTRGQAPKRAISRFDDKNEMLADALGAYGARQAVKYDQRLRHRLGRRTRFADRKKRDLAEVDAVERRVERNRVNVVEKGEAPARAFARRRQGADNSLAAKTYAARGDELSISRAIRKFFSA